MTSLSKGKREFRRSLMTSKRFRNVVLFPFQMSERLHNVSFGIHARMHLIASSCSKETDDWKLESKGQKEKKKSRTYEKKSCKSNVFALASVFLIQ